MHRLYTFGLALSLAVPVMASAQGPQTTDAASTPTLSYSSSTADEGAGQPTSAPMPHLEHAVGSITMSGVYVFQTSSFESNRSLFGWAVTPEVNVYRRLGFQADFASLYMLGVYPGRNAFNILAGPRYTFSPRHNITPFVYGEAGMGRSTTQANDRADWNPIVKAGIVFDYRLTRGLAFEFGPADYVAQKIEWRNTWTQGYSAHAGIVFNLYK
jgi:hypothetical protein